MVECSGLENRRRFTPTVGSNPTPSARMSDLRHTFASYLLMSGASLAELAEALGHKTLAMVKRGGGRYYWRICDG